MCIVKIDIPESFLQEEDYINLQIPDDIFELSIEEIEDEA